MNNYKPELLKGVYSAIFTPYNKNGEVNVSMIEKIVEVHLKSGLKGFYVTGSTGECFMLSEEERKLVIENVIRCNQGRGKVIVHVGHISTDMAINLARYAEKCGADAVSAVGPVYFGSTFDHAYRHYSKIAGSTGLPFILYSLSNIQRDIVPELDIKFFNIKNVIGMKYTGTNFFAMQQLSKMIDKPHIFFSGCDELFLAALSFEVGGCIGTSQNFAPRHFVKIYNRFHEGNIEEARKVQERINKVIYLTLTNGERSYQKAAMRYIGYDCGNFRLPFKQLTEKEYTSFSQKLDRLNVLKKGYKKNNE